MKIKKKRIYLELGTESAKNSFQELKNLFGAKTGNQTLNFSWTIMLQILREYRAGKKFIVRDEKDGSEKEILFPILKN